MLTLPRLSKSTITRGFQALKDLAALIDDNSLAQSKYQTPYPNALEQLSNQYFSIIPHDFGRNRPPVIGSEQMLKKEITLMESLGDMKEAAAIMKAERSNKKRETVHEYDRQYEALSMKEMSPLSASTKEYKEIEAYLQGTKGATHSVKYEVESIFRIERNGEFDRFDSSEYADIPSDRRLLWQ
jgi:poly [ADP-ribose] polymerase